MALSPKKNSVYDATVPPNFVRSESRSKALTLLDTGNSETDPLRRQYFLSVLC